MGRLIEVKPEVRPEAVGNIPRAAADTAPPATPPPDDTLTKVAKLVPTEIVAGYIPLVAAAEAITDKKDTQFTLAFVAFLIGLVLTPIYLIIVGKPTNLAQKVSIIIATVAFVLWAYLLGGPFALENMNNYLWQYDKRVAAFVVGAFTWVMGLLPYEKLLSPPAKQP